MILFDVFSDYHINENNFSHIDGFIYSMFPLWAEHQVKAMYWHNKDSDKMNKKRG